MNLNSNTTADELCSAKCVPCEGGVPKLDRQTSEQMCSLLNEWRLSEDAAMISRKFQLGSFRNAVASINEIAELAEAEQHHPDIHLTGYQRLRVDLTTHAIGGLSENDFILAAKIDRLLGNGEAN